ncbi:aldehyde ferredoxin oxidoreductase family protein [Acidobacteriota bacterium]
MTGYFKKILRVNLSERQVEVCDLDDRIIEKYLGGSGIATHLFIEETNPEIEPLAPDNPLVAFAGPFTGTNIPAASRNHIVSRSPLTGIFGESNVGGSWGVHLRKAGFDGLIVKGKAESPVYLWITEKGVDIRDAHPIWGKNSYESAEWIKSETNSHASVAVIGQAGERLAPIASIPHIGHLVRSASRTGMGAVMGSKNIKAMAVFGTKEVPMANPDALKESLAALMPHVRQATETFSKYGTSGGIDNYEKIGNFPIKNWQGSHWPGAAKISGVAMHDSILTGRRGCWACPIACGRHIKIEDGPYAGLHCEGPEYESIGTLGGECMIDDLKAIGYANSLCNRYGLDTISTGATIAFAMEAFEKGILTPQDTEGIDLKWGNSEALIAIIHKMGLREGIGELMSRGSKAMAETLGKNSVEFAIHVKGLEPSAHDPRRFFSQALSYCTAARGACHNASWSHAYEMALTMPELGIDEPQDPFKIEGKAEFTIKLQNFNTAMDCLIMCRFSQIGRAVSITDIAKWLSMITGRSVDEAEIMHIGERVFNLKRLYNTRLGISRKDDMLPPRFLTLNRKADDLPNQLPPLGQLLSDYYEHRNWTEEGIPSLEKLTELGLNQL